MIFRATGTVTEIGVREGLIKSGPKAGEQYAIPFVVVSLNDFVHNTLNLADSMVGKLGQGEVVDLIVDVTFSNGYLRAQALNYWPTKQASATDAAKLTASGPRPLASASSSV